MLGRVGATDAEADLMVNTRWLGINMGVCDGPILIFETGVWLNPRQDLNRLCVQRYSTKEASRAGHARCVWCIYQGLAPFSEVPPDATCITCQLAPVRDRLRVGSWLCQQCEIEVTAGNLLHPVAKIVAL
jgi:hypothetical protein